MISYSALNKKDSHFHSQKSMKKHPKNSIQKMAVLFTDIVGSSAFFKAHGDLAGRKMLRKHQDLVTPIVKKYGGVVLKILGDSVMAYFFNPVESLKSAIRIQNKFNEYNTDKMQQDQIHIRIGIHYGEGIVEENDIFGDVVNIAAKFLPLVGGDEIFISGSMFQNVKGIHSAHFKPVQVPSNKKVLKGLSVFNVIWETAINLDPISNILLYIKPVWKLGKKSFKNTWKQLLSEKKHLWVESKVYKESILSDASIALIIKKIPSSIEIAKQIVEFLNFNLGQDETSFLPIQIIMDMGPYLRGDTIVTENLTVNWNEIDPGEIYVSSTIYELIHSRNQIPTPQPSVPGDSGQFIKLKKDDQITEEPHLFRYHTALIQGEYPPCFYCGDKRHASSSCPSKHLNNINSALEKLGYQSLSEINNLFFNYLNSPLSNHKGVEDINENFSSNDSSQTACLSFYELNSLYQLRFFKSIWNHREENWNKIKLRRDDRDKGGLLWIALDCLRVGNNDKAHSMLADIIRQDPKDYKAYCTMGFLYIEKNDFLSAKKFFNRALDLAKTSPQKIMIHFLIARIYYLNKELLRAKELARKIIRLSPHCPEAHYLDIVIQFQTNDKTVALHQLGKLVKANREYYLIALIDPQLAHFSEDIQMKLETLFIEAREKAIRILPESKKELDRFESIMGTGSKEISEAKSLLSKIEDLMRTDSFFGYLDVIHYGNSLINQSHRSIEGRKKKLTGSIWDLEQRLKRCIKSVQELAFKSLSEPVAQTIKRFQEKLNKAKDQPDSFDSEYYKNELKKLEIFSSKLIKIESRLERLKRVSHIMLFSLKFLKKTMILQGANLLLALVLFPILTHYLSFAVPSLEITPQNIWYYQKVVIILGGVSGLILASVLTNTDIT